MAFTFSKSKIKLTRFQLIILGVVTSIICLIYVLSSYIKLKIGFPLDDSWIHQTYARNLALNSEWAFRPGQPSAGSTAPLWSALLSIGYILKLSPFIWTFFLGGVILFSLAVLCEWAARNIAQSYEPQYPWIGIFILVEWHLTWSAMSGMETLLHGLVITTVLVLLMIKPGRYLTLGLLTGISIWVRPDGLTLIGPFLVALFSYKMNTRFYLMSILRYFIGFGTVFGIYLLFNLAVGGVPMPNTFYAKQAEYAVWQLQPIHERLWQMLKEISTGPGLLLIPGVIGWLILLIERKDWKSLAVFVWCTGYLYLYASRLPVYQHGRYLIPALPIFYMFGILFMIEFSSSRMLGKYLWLISTFWRICLGAFVIVFIFLGSNTYANDVATVESEMVATAKWVSENLSPAAILAVHDIGAMGYFDNHELIDLAGLVSPEVIPIIRNEPELAKFLDQRNPDYLITFPEFYPDLTRDLHPIFTTESQFTLTFGRRNMTVYEWK